MSHFYDLRESIRREDGFVSENEKSLRLFIALTADGVQKSLQEVYLYLNKYPDVLKTVSPRNYHITLKFLGETSLEKYKSLHEDFAHLIFDIGPIEFRLLGLGGFPDTKRARVIWCGLVADQAKVQMIYEKVEAMSEIHGFKKEDREFAPHFTLARTRRDKKLPDEIVQYLAKNKNTVYGESHFKSIVLFKSELGRKGPAYTPLGEISL